MNPAEKLRQDRRRFDRTNTDPQSVLDAHYYAAFRDTLVIKLPIGHNAASFGIIFLGNKIRDPNTVLHEYGHRVQYLRMGFWRFLRQVAVPSVTANLLDRMHRLPMGYYGSPWESEADNLGGVHRGAALWPEGTYRRYRDLLRLFFRKKNPRNSCRNS